MMDEQSVLPASGKAADRDGETRHQILKAAQELFLERGYKGVSMRDIADVVHVSQAALYYHFPQGKEEVLFATMDDMLTRWGMQVQQIATQSGSLRSKLEWITRNFLSFPFERMMLLMRDIHTLLPESAAREALHQRLGVIQQQSDTIFQTAMDAGEIRSDLPAAYLAQLFGGVLAGTIRYMAVNKTALPLSGDAAATLVSALLDGIAAPS